jgi:hypothetical protein
MLMNVNTISIIGEDVDSALLNNIECFTNNLFCYVFDSIIIWKSNIIHNCPFEYFSRLEFEHYFCPKIKVCYCEAGEFL